MPNPNRKTQSPEYWRDADVIGYVRKSLVLGEEDRISEVKQRDAILRECRALQLAEPAWYVDADGWNSGRHEHKRPAWMAAKTRYLSSPKSVLVVYELDRTNRNVRAMAELVESIRAQPDRYRIVLVMNRYDSARDGWGAREIRSLLDDAVAAQYESDKVSERMTHTIATLKAHRVPWGKYPYGFDRVGRGMKARLVSNQYAQDVRDILTMWARGSTYAEIAADMHARGRYKIRMRKHYRPDHEPVSFPWTLERIRNIHEQVMVYAGYMSANRQESEIRVRDDSLAAHAARYEYARVESIDPIITEELAEAVLRRRLANYTIRHYDRTGWNPMLSGLVWCGDRKLRGHMMRGKRAYRTRSGNPLAWDAETIERELIDHVSALAFPAEVVAGIRAALAERTSQQDAEALGAKLVKMKQSMLDLERRFAIDGMDEAIYKQVKRELQDATLDIERRLREPGLVDVATAALANLGEVLRGANHRHCWKALHSMFERLDLKPGGGIDTITPRPWARDAFYALKSGMQTLPDNGFTFFWQHSGNAGDFISPFEAAYWLFSRLRMPQEEKGPQ